MEKDKINLLIDDNDITDEEYDRVHIPYNNNLDNFMIKYIIPKVFAFQLANSYYRDCLCEATLIQHYKSMTDIINLFPCLDDIIGATIELLNIKYNLTIANNNPLTLEKWQ